VEAVCRFRLGDVQRSKQSPTRVAKLVGTHFRTPFLKLGKTSGEIFNGAVDAP
jgi:hypothetical protein